MMHALYRWLTARHFTATIPAPLFRALHAHMERCPECRAHFARHLEWEALLPDAQARAGERLWRQSAAVAAAGEGRPARLAWGLSLAGAAAAALLVLTLRTPAVEPQLQARGGEAASRIELLARAPGAAGFTPAPAVLAPGSELAFRLDNAEGFGYLVLVMLDHQAQVHLLYPARAGETGLAIAGRVPGSTLPDAFSPDLAPGRVDIVALFSRQPLAVDAVEAALARGGVEEARRELAARGRLQLLTRELAAAAEDGGPR